MYRAYKCSDFIDFIAKNVRFRANEWVEYSRNPATRVINIIPSFPLLTLCTFQRDTFQRNRGATHKFSKNIEKHFSIRYSSTKFSGVAPLIVSICIPVRQASWCLITLTNFTGNSSGFVHSITRPRRSTINSRRRGKGRRRKGQVSAAITISPFHRFVPSLYGTAWH